MIKGQKPNGPVSLAVTLGLAMRHAREVQGYGFHAVDVALGQALAAEAAQRVALVKEGAVGSMPDRQEVAEILAVMLEDVRKGALRALWGSIH